MAHPNSFHACYGLQSLNLEHPNATYIGYTIHPARRLRQHNGEIASGAKKTSKKRPWLMRFCIFGFPTHHQGLKFEFSWQHPKFSKRLIQTIIHWKRLGQLSLSLQQQLLSRTTSTTTLTTTSALAQSPAFQSMQIPTPVTIRKEKIMMSANKRGFEGQSFALALLLSISPWRSMGLKVICDIDAFKVLLSHFYTIEELKKQLISPGVTGDNNHSISAITAGKAKREPKSAPQSRHRVNSAALSSYVDTYIAKYYASQQDTLNENDQNQSKLVQNQPVSTTTNSNANNASNVNSGLIRLNNIEFCESLQWFVGESPLNPALFPRPTPLKSINPSVLSLHMPSSLDAMEDDTNIAHDKSSSKFKTKKSNQQQSSRQLIYQPACERLLADAMIQGTCGICNQFFQPISSTSLPSVTTTTTTTTTANVKQISLPDDFDKHRQKNIDTNPLREVLISNDNTFTPFLYELDFQLSSSLLLHQHQHQQDNDTHQQQEKQQQNHIIPPFSPNKLSLTSTSLSTPNDTTSSITLLSEQQISCIFDQLINTHSSSSLSPPRQLSFISPTQYIDNTIANLDFSQCPHCQTIFHLLCIYSSATYHQLHPTQNSISLSSSHTAFPLHQPTPHKITPCKSIPSRSQSTSTSSVQNLSSSKQNSQSYHVASHQPTQQSSLCSNRLLPEYFHCPNCNQLTVIALLLSNLYPNNTTGVVRKHPDNKGNDDSTDFSDFFDDHQVNDEDDDNDQDNGDIDDNSDENLEIKRMVTKPFKKTSTAAATKVSINMKQKGISKKLDNFHNTLDDYADYDNNSILSNPFLDYYCDSNDNTSLANESSSKMNEHNDHNHDITGTNPIKGSKIQRNARIEQNIEQNNPKQGTKTARKTSNPQISSKITPSTIVTSQPTTSLMSSVPPPTTTTTTTVDSAKHPSRILKKLSPSTEHKPIKQSRFKLYDNDDEDSDVIIGHSTIPQSSSLAQVLASRNTQLASSFSFSQSQKYSRPLTKQFQSQSQNLSKTLKDLNNNDDDSSDFYNE